MLIRYSQFICVIWNTGYLLMKLDILSHFEIFVQFSRSLKA